MCSERVRPAFDEDERERIRSALWRYKKQHKLGFEALANRIAEATGYAAEEGFWKTLQRFMNRSHYTAHDTVGIYVSFLSRVAPPDPGDRAGAALAQFLSGGGSVSMEELAPLAGRYATIIRRPELSRGQMRTDRLGKIEIGVGSKEPEQVPWSVIEFTAPERGVFLRAKETIIDHDYTVAEEMARWPWMKRGTVQSGILAPCGRAEYMVLLRNYLENRIYLLGREARGALRGMALQPTSLVFGANFGPLLPPREPWAAEFEITLAPLPPAKSGPTEEQAIPRVRILTKTRKSR